MAKQEKAARAGGRRSRPLTRVEQIFLRRLGARIKSLRVAAGVTAAEAASTIGITTPTQFHREAGRQSMPVEDLFRYARAIGVEVVTLVDGHKRA